MEHAEGNACPDEPHPLSEAVDVNQTRRWRRADQALRTACQNCDIQALRVALSRSAGLNPDKSGKTALHYAARAGFRVGVDELLKCGFDANIGDSHGGRPVDDAELGAVMASTEKLRQACLECRDSLVRYNGRRCDLQARDDADSFLHRRQSLEERVRTRDGPNAHVPWRDDLGEHHAMPYPPSSSTRATSTSDTTAPTTPLGSMPKESTRCWTYYGDIREAYKNQEFPTDNEYVPYDKLTKVRTVSQKIFECSLCRLIKLLVSRHSSTNVFLDSDQLEDLDLIFNTIRATTKSVVVVLTPELLKRMWCAGEIVTAFKNNIATVPLVCDGYSQLTDDDIEEIPSVWTSQQKQILANYGIRMEHVKEAYIWLRDTLLSLTMHRFGRPEQKEEVVVTMLQRCKVPLKAIRYADSVWAPTHMQRPRILITGAVTDAEALDACEVFQILARGQLRVDTAVVRTAGDIARLKPWAYYFVVLFSRGMLRDPRFAKILLATGAGLRDNKTMEVLEERTLEIVTVSADVGFEFPSADFFQELEEHGLGQADLGPETGPRLSKAYRSLLNILALPLSPLGSEGLLHKQVSEISRRFRRYKDPALALAMDAADDAKIEKEQGPRTPQTPVVDKPVKPAVPDAEEVDIDIDNFEDLRKNIRSEEL
ncbi:unnamed protein product [Symbiodinium sp. KB8]|nr:unnamed protein product [Symbiodinium sp. KB8]